MIFGYLISLGDIQNNRWIDRLSAVKLEALMQQSGVAFGTSGARGLVTAMTDEVCAAYTSAFLKVLAAHYTFDRVAIGVDLRPSSLDIAAACASAIRNAGLEVDFLGALPTPGLALYAQEQSIPAIMVTGSHIPFDRNGLKFYRPDGEITKADEVAMLQAEIALVSASAQLLPQVNEAAVQAYEQRYVGFFPTNILAGLKLGLYEHSSVARDPIKRILEQLGAEVVSLGRTEVFIPIDTEAVSPEDIERGRAWSAEYGFDAIISTDGDGDRPLMSDEHGDWLRGDIVGLLSARYLGVSHLAVPVSCNTAIELSAAFSRVVRTRIGSPYVIAAMQQLQAEVSDVAGFEANGGFLLGSAITKAGKVLASLPTRDAVLPVLAVLASARELAVPVSALLAGLPQRYTASDRLQNFPTATSQALISSWIKDPAAFFALFDGAYGIPVKQDVTDGLRFTFQDGNVIHLRPSGNAPELRCYCEGSTFLSAQITTATVLAKIRQLA